MQLFLHKGFIILLVTVRVLLLLSSSLSFLLGRHSLFKSHIVVYRRVIIIVGVQYFNDYSVLRIHWYHCETYALGSCLDYPISVYYLFFYLIKTIDIFCITWVWKFLTQQSFNSEKVLKFWITKGKDQRRYMSISLPKNSLLPV